MDLISICWVNNLWWSCEALKPHRKLLKTSGRKAAPRVTLEADAAQTTRSFTIVSQRVGASPSSPEFQFENTHIPEQCSGTYFVIQYLFCPHKKIFIEFLYVMLVTLYFLASDTLRRKQQETQFKKSKNISKELYLKIDRNQLNYWGYYLCWSSNKHFMFTYPIKVCMR